MIQWNQMTQLNSRKYTCGHCGAPVATVHGWTGNGSDAMWNPSKADPQICICHHCGGPTFFAPNGDQMPAAGFGDPVSDVSDKKVHDLYEEARRCTTANAFTAAVLCCRKLLMHIAVSKGAQENLTFAEYVKYLIDNHYVPPGSEKWVDHIRGKGNEANHEVAIMSPDEAELLLTYSGMLLKMIYEFPATLQKTTAPRAAS